jgi:hypothetical protein
VPIRVGYSIRSRATAGATILSAISASWSSTSGVMIREVQHRFADRVANAPKRSRSAGVRTACRVCARRPPPPTRVSPPT